MWPREDRGLLLPSIGHSSIQPQAGTSQDTSGPAKPHHKRGGEMGGKEGERREGGREGGRKEGGREKEVEGEEREGGGSLRLHYEIYKGTLQSSGRVGMICGHI